MPDVWSWLHALLAAGVQLDHGLPAPVQGVLLGVLLGLALPLALIGLVSLLVWGFQHGCHAMQARRLPVGRRVVVPLDDWQPGFEQFTVRELVRLQRLRHAYYGHHHRVTERL